MKFNERLYITFSKALPKAFIKKVEKYKTYSNMKINPEVWSGFVLFFSLLLSLLSVLIISMFYSLTNLIYLLLFIAFFFVFFFSFYFLLIYSVKQRTKEIERNLPDALQLIAANIRAGLTPDKALFLSARPEFGVLSEEIMFIGEETLAGKPVDKALIDFSKRVDSDVLARTVDLIVQGMNAGGELASLLEKTADDIKMSEVMQEEIQANIGAYVVFLMMAVLLAAPALYAVSVNFVGFSVSIKSNIDVNSFQQQAPISSISGFPSLAAGNKVDLNLLKWFSLINLSISAIFGAIVVGVLRHGEETDGIKNIPLFLVVAIGLFYLTMYLLSGFLSNMVAF